MKPNQEVTEKLKRSEDYKAWLKNAECHLLGAAAIFDKAQEPSLQYSGPELKLPCLFLTGIGIELTLKANLLKQGASLHEIEKFKHDLMRLWQDSRNSTLRSDTLKHSRTEWDYALGANTIPSQQRTKFDPATFEEYLRALSKVYSRETTFALRYPNDDETLKTPAPFMLIRPFLIMTKSL